MENPNTWYVYVVECADKSLYCGITTDPARRVRQHNGLEPGGSIYCKGRQPVKMAWVDRRENRSEAAKEEYAIKRLSRTDKQILVYGEVKT